MNKPWIRSLLTFIVSLIGCQSLVGIIWLFTTSDKLHEIALFLGFALPVCLAYLEHDRCTRDPIFMDREAQRERLRSFARDERRETQRPP